MKMIILLFPLLFVANFMQGMDEPDPILNLYSEKIQPNGVKLSSISKEYIAMNDMYKINNSLPMKQKELPAYYDETKRIFEHQLLQAAQRKLELKKTLKNQPTPENRENYQQAKVELNFVYENLNNLVNAYKNIQ